MRECHRHESSQICTVMFQGVAQSAYLFFLMVGSRRYAVSFL